MDEIKMQGLLDEVSEINAELVKLKNGNVEVRKESVFLLTTIYKLLFYHKHTII